MTSSYTGNVFEATVNLPAGDYAKGSLIALKADGSGWEVANADTPLGLLEGCLLAHSRGGNATIKRFVPSEHFGVAAVDITDMSTTLVPAESGRLQPGEGGFMLPTSVAKAGEFVSFRIAVNGPAEGGGEPGSGEANIIETVEAYNADGSAPLAWFSQVIHLATKSARLAFRAHKFPWTWEKRQRTPATDLTGDIANDAITITIDNDLPVKCHIIVAADIDITFVGGVHPDRQELWIYDDGSAHIINVLGVTGTAQASVTTGGGNSNPAKLSVIRTLNGLEFG